MSKPRLVVRPWADRYVAELYDQHEVILAAYANTEEKARGMLSLVMALLAADAQEAREEPSDDE